MNKTVFIMDSSGNAVQWAAGMRLEVESPGMVNFWYALGQAYTIHAADPRACVSHFVRALCACPDGSLLEWDEDKGMVECKTWLQDGAITDLAEWVAKTGETPEPAPTLLPDGRPIIPVPGHKKWRELYDDEVIQKGDWWYAFPAMAWEEAAGVIGFTTEYFKNREGRQFPECKACRRIKPKKQKAGEVKS